LECVGVGITGRAQGQHGPFWAFPQSGWEMGSRCIVVSSVRHRASTAHLQFFPCPNSSGQDVVRGPARKPPWCRPPLPSLGAPCAGKRCSQQGAEPWLQTPQQRKHITCRVRKHGAHCFVLGQFTFWKSQFPSKLVLRQKPKFAHLFCFKRGRKTGKT